MNCPKVSIVIPVYNGSNYLAEAVESALAQTYENIEIIVVNDGSKDNGATAAVARKYADKIRYFEKENGGSSSAINFGIRMMEGEWFSWLSHDDLYLPDKVRMQMQRVMAMEEPEKHVFFSGCELMNHSGARITRDTPEKMRALEAEILSYSNNDMIIAQPRKYNFHGCSCLIHKSVFENVGVLDEKLRVLNDVELWFRIYSAGYKLTYIPEVLVKGRIHAQQVGRSIGYSAQHPESDMLWTRRLNWLKDNSADNDTAFCVFGENAYLSGRPLEGDLAFQIARSIKPENAAKLAVRRLACRSYAKLRQAGKKLYVMLSKH